MLKSLQKPLLALVLSVPFLGVAQDLVRIEGRVYSPEMDRAYYDLMIVNKRTHSGVFGNPDGTFSVMARRSDTLLLGAIGLNTVAITVADSAHKDSYKLTVRMTELRVQLRAVEVLPERELQDIQRDIEKLGYDERDHMIYGVDALTSPITFLYQAFSKRERSKRLVAELINEDRKRELLKELLHKYVEYDIINLSDESFDEFIDFVDVPEQTMKHLTQYDFLMYIRKKYELYTSLGPTRRH